MKVNRINLRQNVNCIYHRQTPAMMTCAHCKQGFCSVECYDDHMEQARCMVDRSQGG